MKKTDKSSNEEEKITEIKDNEHSALFFGVIVKKHKNNFNKYINEAQPKTIKSCWTFFRDYRHKIIENFNEHARLDWKTEGAECGMNNWPTEEECENHLKNLNELNDYKSRLENCMKN